MSRNSHLGGPFRLLLGSAIRIVNPRFNPLPPGVRLGEYTYLSDLADSVFRTGAVDKGHDVVIGKFCSIAPGVRILSYSEHRLEQVSTYPFKTLLSIADGKNYDAIGKGTTRIGNDVWIGTASIILAGVSVGDGAVVGAGSVVASDVPPYAIVAGNPARVLRYRFSKQQIEGLKRVQWWNWDINSIKARESDFYCDIDSFLGKYDTEGRVRKGA